MRGRVYLDVRRIRRIGALAMGLLLAFGPTAGLRAATPSRDGHWVGVWATAVMPADSRSAIADDDLRGATVRQVVQISSGGRRIRLRLSNNHGTKALALSAVRVARTAKAGGGAIEPGAGDGAVTFSGRAQVSIPAGAYYLSDPVAMPVTPGESLTISMFFAEPPAAQTIHHLALSTGYVAPGDQTAAPILENAKPIRHWYQLAAVEAERDPTDKAGAVAILGDSITDGDGSTLDANNRWPDVLAARLRADPAMKGVSVLNLGIAGNRLMRDGPHPSGLARLDRDVLSQAGLRTVIVFEGVNDLGLISREGPVTPEGRAQAVNSVIDGYQQVIARARARGLRVIGVTLLPFGGTRVYRSDADADADRRQVNDWIRKPGHFDAVIDFDAVVRDPAAPNQLQAPFDSGDHLHPSAPGYQAMGSAVPLGLLKASRAGN